MNNNCPSILTIDDKPGIHEVLSRLLEPEFATHAAYSGLEGLEKVNVIEPDLILLDLRMPQMSGITFLKRLRETGKDIPVIVLTAYGSVDSAVQAIKLGAVDYIEKPFENQRLKQTVKTVLSRRRTVGELPIRQGIVGESPQIRKVWQLVEKYGPTDLPILLEGETGTGKELFARAIHEISKRSQGPFVAVDCSILPESLVESELFGYEKGAFTGANVNKPGRLEWADGGTFLLDEISNLSLSYQAKFLRVFQEQQYIPLGAKKVKFLNVRSVSTSNIDLREAIRQGAFREDLYYRVSGVVIELPPLREREGDIDLLARYFVKRYGKRYNKPNLEISDETIELLLSYQWPGNVREVEHAISGAVVVADQVILPEHLPFSPQRRAAPLSERSETSPAYADTADKHADRDDDIGKIELKLSFVCNIRKPIDLKKYKAEVASKVERQIINEIKKRLSLNQTELAKFLQIDSKTLRNKEKKI